MDESTVPTQSPSRRGTGSTTMPLWVTGLLAYELLLGMLFVADWALGSPSWQLNVWLDFEHEGAFATWFSSMQLFAVGVLLALWSAGVRLRGERDILLLVLPPLLFLVLSMDEVVQVHEWIGYKIFPKERRAASAFDYVGIWGFVLGPVLLLVAGWIGWRGRRYLRQAPSVLRRYGMGLLVFVGAGAFLEELANFVEPNGVAHTAEVFVEEVGEMMGATLILWAAWDMFRLQALAPVLARASQLLDAETVGCLPPEQVTDGAPHHTQSTPPTI